MRPQQQAVNGREIWIIKLPSDYKIPEAIRQRHSGAQNNEYCVWQHETKLLGPNQQYEQNEAADIIVRFPNCHRTVREHHVVATWRKLSKNSVLKYGLEEAVVMCIHPTSRSSMIM
jgi:hypothetical protein